MLEPRESSQLDSVHLYQPPEVNDLPLRRQSAGEIIILETGVNSSLQVAGGCEPREPRTTVLSPSVDAHMTSGSETTGHSRSGKYLLKCSKH